VNDLIELQRRHFDQIASTYNEQRSHPNHQLIKHLIWLHFLQDKRKSGITCHNVLEPMCGLGEGYDILKNYLCSNDFSYSGFDYSQPMVDAARALHPELSFAQCDVSRFRPEERAWDFIVLIGGLHHVYAHSEAILEQLTAGLKSGGYFLSFEPTHSCWLTRKIREKIYSRNPIFDDISEQGFVFNHLDSMFLNLGYRKTDQVHAGLSAYILYYNPDAFPHLNLGHEWAVRAAFRLDRLFWRNCIGRKFSFATITLWQKT